MEYPQIIIGGLNLDNYTI